MLYCAPLCAVYYMYVLCTGYFLRVLQEGEFRPGSEVLRVQPGPDSQLSVRKVAQGLWGPPALQDHSREFLSALVNSEVLLEHLFRNTARERLRRLDEQEAAGKEGEGGGTAESRLVAEDEALAEYNFKCISIFMTLLCAYLFLFYGNKDQA